MKRGLNAFIIIFVSALLVGGTSTYAITNDPVMKKVLSAEVLKEKSELPPKTITKTIQKNKIVSIDNITAATLKGIKYTLPYKIYAKMSNGDLTEQFVSWDTKVVNVAKAGVFSFLGSVRGYDKQVLLTLNVNEITKIDDFNDISAEDKNFVLPTSVVGEISDFTSGSFSITWDMNNIEKPEPGISIYYGTVIGYDNKVKYIVNRRLPVKVKEILGNLIKPDMNDFDKELAIHNYLIAKTTYSREDNSYSESDLSDYDVIVNGKGNDYSGALNRLLNAAGIDCKRILGEVKIGNNWQYANWNLVKIMGNYYHVDISLDNLRSSDGGVCITYKYLNLCDNDIKVDHRWKEDEYEPCVSLQYDISSIRNTELDTKSKQIITQIITSGMNDIQKETSIHNYVVENTIYDSGTYDTVLNKGIYILDDNNSAYAALVKGKTMCQGYAEAINKLLTMAGIESIVIVGEAKDSKGIWEGHAWNLVKLDNEYYHLDATWDDPVNINGDQILRYSYFNLTDDIISKDHRWDAAKYPLAAGTKYSETNLKLAEKDSKGNDILIISSTNEFYNTLANILSSHKDKVSVKILSYTDSYIDTMKSAFNNSSMTKCDYSYYDDNFGSRYYEFKITY
jgi:hypothetical protein